MCEKYIIEEYAVPLIWAQRVNKTKRETRNNEAEFENIGEPIGPFLVGRALGRYLNFQPKNLSVISNVLNKNVSIEGYKFYTENEQKIMFKIPNVDYGKSRFKFPKKHTKESIHHNLTVCGFNVTEIEGIKGSMTRISVKCCNVDCEGNVNKNYNHFTSACYLPICNDCRSVLKSIQSKNKTLGDKLLCKVRPELKKYYREEDNDDMPFEKILAGSSQKIYLHCDECGHIQPKNKLRTPNSYTAKKKSGEYYSDFKCLHCMSVAVNNPSLAKEWDSEKNIGTPYDYTCSSSYEAHWVCENNHHWKSKIASRCKLHSGCPHCKGSKGEKLIAEYLTSLDVKFHSQYSTMINNVNRRFDFYLEEYNLFLEIMGAQHYNETKFGNGNRFVPLVEQQKIDQQKKQYAQQNGYYMEINYSEHKPELALDRFQEQFDKFLEDFINEAV